MEDTAPLATRCTGVAVELQWDNERNRTVTVAVTPSFGPSAPGPPITRQQCQQQALREEMVRPDTIRILNA